MTRRLIYTAIFLGLCQSGLAEDNAPTVQREGRDAAEKLFRKMEKTLEKAKTLECVVVVKVEQREGKEEVSGRYDGSLLLAEKNKARLEINEAKEGRPLRVLLVSDGRRTRMQDNGGGPWVHEAQKDFNAEILVWVTRTGVFLPQAPLPPVNAADGKERFRVSDFRLGNKEKIRGLDAQRLGYDLVVKGEEGAFSVVVWLDLETDLPVQREVSKNAGANAFKVTESYEKLVLDGTVDLKKFVLPD